jgi:TolB-like protein
MKRWQNPLSLPAKFLVWRLAAFTVLAFALVFHSGCTSFNGTRLETILGNKTNLIQFSYTIADHLTERARPPLVPSHPDMPVLVTTFVDNNDLQQTSRLGRVLQEHIVSRLVQRGYTVRETKLAGTLHIEPQSGETILSRDLAQLTSGQQAQAILVGTISRSNRILYISARLINPVNNNILATDDSQLCMDDNILALFGLQHQPESDQPIDEPRQPLLNSVL